MVPAGDKPERDLNLALLSWVQQSAPYGVFMLNEALEIQGWNQWMEVHSGKKFAAVAGQKLLQLYPELEQRRLAARFERALQGESSVLSTALHSYLLPFPSPLPETGFPFMRQTVRITPLRDGQGVCGVVVVIEDVTQRESQAEDLRWQHRRDEMFSWALSHLLKTHEPSESIRQLFFKVAEHLDLDTFLFYLSDNEQGTLRLHSAGGLPSGQEADFLQCPFPINIQGKFLSFNSIQTRSDQELLALKNSGLAAAVALPLVGAGGGLGLLCFASARRKSIGSEEIELLSMIAQHLATAIEREDTNRQLRKAKEQLVDYSQLLEKRVEQRTSRLQETVAELETLCYTIAHDLKAPLRAVTEYSYILLNDFSVTLPQDGKMIAGRLLRNSKRMEGLIRDLLAFNKVSRDEVVVSSVALFPLLNEILALRLPEIRAAVSIQSPLHDVVANRVMLQQVLSNLIDNAVKFVKPGLKPKIRISSEIVASASPSTRLRGLTFSSLESSPENVPAADPALPKKRIRIRVCDEGIGIPPNALQKIFGIFERDDAAAGYEGNGIGLAIVARAVERMGGTCGVDSEVEKGSCFWLELPEG